MMQFLAIVLIALALVPGGAHLLELPNKIGLSQEQYFTVQGIYLGWALPAGVVLIGALAASLVLTIMLRGRGRHSGLRWQHFFWSAQLALCGATLSTLIECH
jgi:hypothetical protein